MGVAIIFFLFFFNRVGSKIVLKLIACFWPKKGLLLSPDPFVQESSHVGPNSVPIHRT